MDKEQNDWKIKEATKIKMWHNASRTIVALEFG